MAALKFTTDIALTSYLICLLTQSNERRGFLEYEHLTIDVRRRQIRRAFQRFLQDGVIDRFLECEDGVIFLRSDRLIDMATTPSSSTERSAA